MSQHKQSNQKGLMVLLIAAVAVCIAAVMLWTQRPERPEHRPAGTTAAPVTDAMKGTAPQQTQTEQTRPESQERLSINLGYGLEIIDAGRYTGMYMEDGSNELLSDVMMIIVRNVGSEDIQLANIDAVCGGSDYRFTLTNLAAGAQVVLLDLDRKPSAEITGFSAVMEAPVLFQMPMQMQEDSLRIGGSQGMLEVENISGADIGGDICIYYKYAAEDILYGGITFRVRIEGGLKAGEQRRVQAGHYDPARCALVQVTFYD